MLTGCDKRTWTEYTYPGVGEVRNALTFTYRCCIFVNRQPREKEPKFHVGLQL